MSDLIYEMREIFDVTIWSLVALAAVIILLFICKLLPKKTWPRKIADNVLKNPFLATIVITVVFAIATVWLWVNTNDEITLLAWSIVVGSIVGMITAYISIGQSNKSDFQQKQLIHLEYKPTLLITEYKRGFSDLINCNAEEHTFLLECISEHPAFGIKWFIWKTGDEILTVKVYDIEKSAVSIQIHTAVTGKQQEFSLFFDARMATKNLYLVAEFYDTLGNKCIQPFKLVVDALKQKLITEEIGFTVYHQSKSKKLKKKMQDRNRK